MPDQAMKDIEKELTHARLEIEQLTSAAKEYASIKNALFESENRYRATFEYTGTAMLVIDEDTTLLMANHKLEEITGYAHEESVQRKKWTEVVVPEDLDRMMEYHRNRRSNPESVPNEYEFRLIDRHGQKRDILLHVSLIPGTEKSLVSLVDISHLKQTERALRESEQQYRELFENANDIIYTIDLDGNFTSANISALRTFGYTREEMLTTNIRQVIDPAYIDVAIKNISDKISLNTTTRYELLTHTRDDKPVWVEVSTQILRNTDNRISIQGIARDISERKMFEEQLQESSVRFKEMADLLPGIICEIDSTLRLTYANELGLTFFGYTHEDFERGISVMDIVPEYERERFMQDVFNVTHGDFGNPKLYELVRKDGRAMQLIVNSAPMLKNGTATGIRSCLIDISDRIMAEQSLRESEKRFRSIFDASPIGIALFSVEGNILSKNTSFAQMVSPGLTEDPANLTGLSGIDTLDLQQLATGKATIIETSREQPQNLTKPCTYLEWHLSCISSSHNKDILYLAQVQDITSRKLAQEAHLQKEREATARAEARIAGLQRQLQEQAQCHNMVSCSPAMKQIFDILPEVALASASVLIMGDSGTGKELIARSLHELSNRKDKPLVAINCSALPDTLLESELFGYKTGAFTDAKKDKPGRFALAEGGSLFLDEIGDISPAMQVKLLRVLQERVYEPLGATSPVKTDVRVIAATNKNISDMVNKGTFREDLFYRINIVTIELPPLKDRRCDIPLLCTHFIERFNLRYNKNIAGLTDSARALLLAHDFPGNIRELENVIEHAFIFCKEPWIDTQHLPAPLKNRAASSEPSLFSDIKNFAELERMYLKSVLADCNNDRMKTAERLGIHKATLFRKLKQFGI